MEIIDAIFAVISCGLIVFFFLGPWQSILVDISRQRLFEIREQLFDFAANGSNPDFTLESQSYRYIREWVNTSIRYCHEAKFSRFTASCLYKSNESGEKSNKLFEYMEDIKDPSTQKEVYSKIGNAAEIIALLMVIRSPILMFILLIILPVIGVFEIMSGKVMPFLQKTNTQLKEAIDLRTPKTAC